MRVLPSLGGISNILESIPACLTPVTLSTNLLYIYVFGLSKAPFKLKKEIWSTVQLLEYFSTITYTGESSKFPTYAFSLLDLS